MIRYISLLLLSSIYLFGLGFWTLTGVTKANIYIQNAVVYLKAETKVTAREKMTAMLKSQDIKLDLPDSPTLMLDLQDIENDGEHYVYIKLALGEEVRTFRDDKSAAFAITYQVTDFLEVNTQELDKEILESVDFLLSQFVEQFEDDKE